MSYINDALRKARKVKSEDQAQIKKTIWSSLTGAVSAEGKKNDTWRKWYTVIGLSIALLYAAGIIAVMYWSDIKPMLASSTAPSSAVSGEPARVTAAPVAVVPEQTVSRPIEQKQAPQETALPNLPPPAAGEVEKPKAVAAAIPVEVKKDEKSEAPEDVTPEPPKKKVLGNPKKLYAQALKMQREGKLDQARELYRQVIEREPGNVRALNNLGVVYMKMKRYKWAVVRLNEAVRFKPDYVDAHYNLACVYAQLKYTQKSLFYLKKAIELNPEAKLWAAKDSDFKGLTNLAEYKNIIQAQDN